MDLVDGVTEGSPDLIGTGCVHLDERSEGLVVGVEEWVTEVVGFEMGKILEG